MSLELSREPVSNSRKLSVTSTSGKAGLGSLLGLCMFHGGNSASPLPVLKVPHCCICVGRGLETPGNSSVLPFSGTVEITQKVSMPGMQDKEAIRKPHGLHSCGQSSPVGREGT